MELSRVLLNLLEPALLATIVICTLYGSLVGALPGLSATMAVALLIPFTFFMEPVQAITAIVATTSTAIFAGDISGALLRIPGTPASAAYVDDSATLAHSGKARTVLFTSLFTGAAGGVLGVMMLALFTPYLAAFARVLGASYHLTAAQTGDEARRALQTAAATLGPHAVDEVNRTVRAIDGIVASATSTVDDVRTTVARADRMIVSRVPSVPQTMRPTRRWPVPTPAKRGMMIPSLMPRLRTSAEMFAMRSSNRAGRAWRASSDGVRDGRAQLHCIRQLIRQGRPPAPGQPWNTMSWYSG